MKSEKIQPMVPSLMPSSWFREISVWNVASVFISPSDGNMASHDPSTTSHASHPPSGYVTPSSAS